MPFGSIARSGEIAFLVAGLMAIAGCSAAPDGDSALALQRDPIVGGALDTTDDAVMALIRINGGLVGACSGTTIAKVGGSGFLLTAGHCVTAVDNKGNAIMPLTAVDPASLFVLPGPDYGADHTSVFRVADVKFNPRYDGSVESPFDIAIVRYLGATDKTVVVPALTPADDTLVASSVVTLVGFGVTENNQQNTVRRKVDKPISRLTSQQLVFDQTDGKGSCEGDSGGPALFQTPAGPRVAAVTSSGDATCSVSGVSVRTSPSSTFLQDFIDSAPKTLGCDECLLASTAPGNACAAQYADCQSGSKPCGQFLDCATQCKTSSCVDTCRSSNRTGAQANDALGKCECSDVCAGVCAQNAKCAPPTCGGLGVAGAECNGCIQQHCCTEAAACGADAACQACFGSSSPECPANPLYHTLLTCLSSCDANPCRIAAASLNPGTVAPPVVTPDSDGGAAAGDDAGAPSPPGADSGDTVVQASTSGGCSCRVGAPLGDKRAPFALLLLLGAAARLRRRSSKLSLAPRAALLPD